MTLDLARFVKILGMTGSSHDGEALAALRKAQDMMAAERITWGDLIGGHRSGWHSGAKSPFEGDVHRAASRKTSHVKPMPHEDLKKSDPNLGDKLRENAQFILDEYPELLSEWEQSFIRDWEYKPWHRPMTDKQINVFVRIMNKHRVAANHRRAA